jgi:hypothetical protein
LAPAFGLVTLFLLARVFFLAFVKTWSSSSWHPNLQSLGFASAVGSLWLLSSDRRECALPAGFARLARMTLVVVATATTATAKTLSPASATPSIGFRLSFVNL